MFWSSARQMERGPMADRIVSDTAQAALKKKVAASGRVTSRVVARPFLRLQVRDPSFPQSRLATGRAARRSPKRVDSSSVARFRGDCSSAVTSAAIDRGARLRVAASEALPRWSVCPELAVGLSEALDSVSDIALQIWIVVVVHRTRFDCSRLIAHRGCPPDVTIRAKQKAALSGAARWARPPINPLNARLRQRGSMPHG